MIVLKRFRHVRSLLLGRSVSLVTHALARTSTSMFDLGVWFSPNFIYDVLNFDNE